jgi:hypothetical protein
VFYQGLEKGGKTIVGRARRLPGFRMATDAAPTKGREHAKAFGVALQFRFGHSSFGNPAAVATVGGGGFEFVSGFVLRYSDFRV